jgi:hypothetical protein
VADGGTDDKLVRAVDAVLIVFVLVAVLMLIQAASPA